MSYADLITRAMRGQGQLTNRQIYVRVYREAKRTRQTLPFYWRATIRNTLQRHSRQSPKFVKPHLFDHIKPGIWEHHK